MLFTRAPRGHAPAVATRPGATSQKCIAIGGGVGALAALIVVDVILGLPTVISGGLAGLIGVGVVYAAGSHTYAVGPTWFRRGTEIVHTHDLTSIEVRHGIVELLDARKTENALGWLRQGRCRFPFAVLHEQPSLYGPLRRAMDIALRDREVRVNPEANESFALGMDTPRRTG